MDQQLFVKTQFYQKSVTCYWQKLLNRADNTS